jgi:hypothetical protein
MIISIINVDLVSPVKQLGESVGGSYGQVYQYCFNNAPLAIKCIKILENEFELSLKTVIKEYLLLTVASTIQAGPNL